MKAYINQLLFQNAAQYVDLAFKASGEMAVHDEVRFSYGVLLDKFSAATAAQAVRRTIAAVRVIRDVAGGGGLDWLKDVEEPFGWAT